MRGLLAALDYAHARAVVHRDIKPANVLLPAPDWPMLADFGISKLLNDIQPQLTSTGVIVGTAAYMAPEQALGQTIDARTDLYSAGVVLYELLTGHIPFESDTPTGLLLQHAYAQPRPPSQLNPDLPVAVDELLLRALAKNPAERFPTARAFAEELERIARDFVPASNGASIARLFAAGALAFEHGRWDEAQAHLGQLIALAPEHAEGMRLLGAARACSARAKDAARQQILQASSPAPTTLPPAAEPHSATVQLDDRATVAQGQAAAQPPAANPAPSVAAEVSPASPPTATAAHATAANLTGASPPAGARSRRLQYGLGVAGAVVALLAIALFAWSRLNAGGAPASAPTNVAVAGSATAATQGDSTAPASTAAPANVLAPTNTPASGALIWQDVALRNDGVTLTVRGLPQPDSGEVYAAWLVSDQNSLPIGELRAGDSNSWSLAYTSPQHDNLLGSFDRVYVTRVPDAAAMTEVANVVMAGTLPLAELAHIRHGLFSYEITPNKIGFALGLRQELIEVLQHAQLLKSELDAGRLGGEQLHSEHIINIIEGQQGQHFGDLNHDGKVQNPGDGFGVLQNGTQQGYIAGMVEHALLAAAAPDAPATAKGQANALRADGDALRDQITQIRDLTLAVDQASTAAATRENVLKIVDLSNQALNGDRGALIMYQQLQAMALIALAPVDPKTIINAPVPVPEPKPTGAATTVAVGDNTFMPSKITIVRGTTIVWKSQSGVAHTVTADDGSFDSKTLPPNGTFTHTFGAAGVFPYYCQIHGGPHGEGMSGAIIVTDAAAAPQP
jgi:plastocyanin